MKTINLLILFFIAQLAYAQNIDSTLVFETEEVAEFKKETILEQFHVPYDVEKEAKFMLRFAPGNFAVLTKSNPSNLNESSFAELMVKVGVANAITAGFWSVENFSESTIRSNPFVSFRHYLGMKQLVEDKVQKPNFTGRYMSFTVGYNILNQDADERNLYIQTTNITRQNDGVNLRLNYGTQLGAFFDMSIEGGLKSYFSTQVGTSGLIEMPTAQDRRLMPYIATRVNLTDGFLSGRNETSCEFLNCFRELDNAIKIGLNDLLYADPTVINTNLSVAYERRIGDSFFSSNSGSAINLGLIKQFVPTGETVDFVSGRRQDKLVPTFSDLSKRNFVASLTVFQELRYYAFQKRRIANGKSAKNFNDFYFSSIGSYQLHLADKLVLFTNAKDAINENTISFGLGAGFQNVVAAKYFIDTQGQVFFANNSGFTSPSLQLKLAVGLIK